MKPGRQEVDLMPFAPIACVAPNPDAWVIHPLIWLQPELTLSGPPATALRIARRYEIPPPQFASVAPGLGFRGAGPAGLGSPLVAGFRPARRNLVEIPESHLTPLGWDPRTMIQKGATP